MERWIMHGHRNMLIQYFGKQCSHRQLLAEYLYVRSQHVRQWIGNNVWNELHKRHKKLRYCDHLLSLGEYRINILWVVWNGERI